MISTTLLLLSSGILGVFLGAQITEAILFVPYWKKMKPNDFFELHKQFGDKIYKFFAPITIAATILPLITAAYLLTIQPKELLLITTMGISTLMFFSTFYLYFKKANKSFADRSLKDNELKNELIKWGNWHWGRIVFEFISLTCSLILLSKF